MESIMTIVNCKECDRRFYKSPQQILKHPNNFCSRSCAATYNNKGQQRNPPKSFKCECCNIFYIRTLNHRNEKFCSRDCLIKMRNLNKQNTIKKKNKNYKKKQCATCTNVIHFYSIHCGQCHMLTEREIIRNTTLNEYHQKISVLGKHPSWINAQIRQFNRSWNKELTKLPCAYCTYDKHVELAHIKAVTSFDGHNTIGEVNELPNIIQLCRNCHWEFDNGLLSIEDIKNKQLLNECLLFFFVAS